MLSYALRRLAMIIPVLLGISIIVFLIMAMIPGDPALAILGSFATPENTAQLRQDLGLDRPLIQQYAIWLGNLLQGDFGRSYSTRSTSMVKIGLGGVFIAHDHKLWTARVKIWSGPTTRSRQTGVAAAL